MVLINENGTEKSALVIVPDYQLSLAIGKEGQNVRLAARLCGWKIDIKSHSKWEEMQKTEKAAPQKAEEIPAEKTTEYTASAVKKMKKADLAALAEENGIEIEDGATNAQMAEAIIAAMGL